MPGFMVKGMVPFAGPRSGLNAGRIGGCLHARASLEAFDDAEEDEQRLPSVAYEDDKLLIINKPYGLGFHGEEDGTPGVMTVLRGMQGRGELEYTGKLYPVHRLDKVTSGCLMLAKTGPAASEIMQALAERRVAKYYVALSDKKPSKKMGTISGDMTRGRRSTWRLQRSQENPAVTSFVQHSFNAAALIDDQPVKLPLRIFLLRPKTGKSHQLRVALRSLSAPILGDELYYTGENKDGRRSSDEDRTYLHACAVRLIVHGELIQAMIPPWDGGGVLFEASEFKEAFENVFPTDMIDDEGVWFRDTSLLRSDPAELAVQGKKGPDKAPAEIEYGD